MPKAFSAVFVGAALSVALAGCSGLEQTRERQEVALEQCSFACNAAGAWVFGDGANQWVVDIWMKPDGVHVRNRETEDVRFYKKTSLDNYRHEDGERLELRTNDDMIRHLPSGVSMPQRRLPS